MGTSGSILCSDGVCAEHADLVETGRVNRVKIGGLNFYMCETKDCQNAIPESSGFAHCKYCRKRNCVTCGVTFTPQLRHSRSAHCYACRGKNEKEGLMQIVEVKSK